MLANLCDVMEVGVMCYVRALMAVMGCFPSDLLGKQIVVGKYSGTLKCAKLYVDRSVESRYWERFMSNTLKEFRTYAVHIWFQVKDGGGTCHQTWVGPGNRNRHRYIHDLQNLEGDRTSLVVGEQIQEC